MIALKNCTRRIQTYNLDAAHFEACEGEHGFKLIHTTVVDHDPQTGALYPRRTPKHVCEALTLLAGETRPNLPNQVLDCLDVKLAVQRGDLRVTDRSEDEPAPTPTPSGDDDHEGDGDDADDETNDDHDGDDAEGA